MHAAGICDEEQMKRILEQSPELNARDNAGRTALHHACKAGNIGAFKALVDHDDTDIDPVTKSGVTPLMMAVESGKI